MKARLLIAVVAMTLNLGTVGCAPKELFSCIDRHCFVADWTNHYSCVSCCHGNCRKQGPHVVYPMLELGEPPNSEAQIK